MHTHSGTPLMTVKDLSKTYRSGDQHVEAVQHVSFSIYPGETVALVGVSGCGKSTLLSMVGQILEPSEGEIWIDGQDTVTLSTSKRARLRNTFFGFVVQEFALIEDASSSYNVELPMLLHTPRWPRKKRTARSKELLESVQLQDKASTPVKKLSGGQRQRVAIARSLAMNPTLILADEPTGSLDHQNADEIVSLLFSHINESRGLLLVTHNEQLAALCDRKIVMHEGKILT